MRKTILTPDSRLSEIKAILEKYRLKYGQWNKNVADAFRNKYCCNLSDRDWGEIEWTILYLLCVQDHRPMPDLSNLYPPNYND